MRELLSPFAALLPLFLVFGAFWMASKRREQIFKLTGFFALLESLCGFKSMSYPKT